jgi:TniQ
VGESLSSWFERLAYVYGCSARDLLQYDLGFEPMSSAQLDVNPPEKLLENLSERTGVPFDRIRAMTARAWVPLLIDSVDSNSNGFRTYVGEHSILFPAPLRPLNGFKARTPWLSQCHLQRTFVCRSCLDEDPEPYRRISWRMAWMTTCPTHGVMLNNGYSGFGANATSVGSGASPAPPELIALDRLTVQAVEKGSVSLPLRKVHGGVWLRLLRALIDELSLPAYLVRRYRPNIVEVWKRIGRKVRQGLPQSRVAFELMTPEHQIVVMRAAAAAVQLMCEKRLKKSGDQALLFQPLPIDPEDLLSSPPINSDEQYQDIDNNSKYDILWQKINALMEESVEKMRSNRDFATSIRAFLLGSNPTAAKIKEIDNFFREFGFLGES